MQSQSVLTQFSLNSESLILGMEAWIILKGLPWAQTDSGFLSDIIDLM